MNRPLTLVLCVLALLAASVHARRTLAQDTYEQPGLLPAGQAVPSSACPDCSPPPRAGFRRGPSSADAAHGFSILGGRHCQDGAGCRRCGMSAIGRPQYAGGGRCGPSSAPAGHAFSFDDGMYCRHGAGCNRCGSAAGHGSIVACIATGQPLIDPWARADWIAANRAATQSWHAGYYHTQYGAPLALVVPPTARMQTRYSWGVAQDNISPIYHQFERPYPDAVAGANGMVVGGEAAGPLHPTPRWPSHTDQFGVYYIRGPW